LDTTSRASMAGMKEKTKLRWQIGWKVFCVCGSLYFIAALVPVIARGDGRRFWHCLAVLIFIGGVPLFLRDCLRYFARLKQIGSDPKTDEAQLPMH
jgi:hypothetical protein